MPDEVLSTDERKGRGSALVGSKDGGSPSLKSEATPDGLSSLDRARLERSLKQARRLFVGLEGFEAQQKACGELGASIKAVLEANVEHDAPF